MQKELALLGQVKRVIHQHPANEIALCKSASAAVYRAMLHAGITQESLAQALKVSEGYMSLLMTGKREWSEKRLRAAAAVTGSLAPIQWLCAQFGGEFYADTVAQRKALLLAELEDLQRQEAKAA